jgi:hypothetical protein
MILDKDIMKNKKPSRDVLINEIDAEDRKELIDQAIFYAASPEAAGLPGFVGQRP